MTHVRSSPNDYRAVRLHVLMMLDDVLLSVCGLGNRSSVLRRYTELWQASGVKHSLQAAPSTTGRPHLEILAVVYFLRTEEEVTEKYLENSEQNINQLVMEMPRSFSGRYGGGGLHNNN